jgi:Domain of unknown function (DUF4167)
MRPGQNKRIRGRNNRKGPNPLTRTYESNGPDVKIRGTAHHVAEKYLQLARDAQSSGDPVMAENYLQHAEHYFRLIAAAQLAQQQAQIGFRPNAESEMDDFDDDDGVPDRFSSPMSSGERYPQQQQPQPFAAQPHPSNQPQPYVDRPAFNNDGGQMPNQPNGQNERGPRQERNFGDRNGNNGQGRDQNRSRRGNRDFRTERQDYAEQPAVNLPAFITAPTRPNAESGQELTQEERPEQPSGGYHLRPRRRRRANDEHEGAPEASSVPEN